MTPRLFDEVLGITRKNVKIILLQILLEPKGSSVMPLNLMLAFFNLDL